MLNFEATLKTNSLSERDFTQDTRRKVGGEVKCYYYNLLLNFIHVCCHDWNLFGKILCLCSLLYCLFIKFSLPYSTFSFQLTFSHCLLHIPHRNNLIFSLFYLFSSLRTVALTFHSKGRFLRKFCEGMSIEILW